MVWGKWGFARKVGQPNNGQVLHTIQVSWLPGHLSLMLQGSTDLLSAQASIRTLSFGFNLHTQQDWLSIGFTVLLGKSLSEVQRSLTAKVIGLRK